jgi:hypothetical protein
VSCGNGEDDDSLTWITRLRFAVIFWLVVSLPIETGNFFSKLHTGQTAWLFSGKVLKEDNDFICAESARVIYAGNGSFMIVWRTTTTPMILIKQAYRAASY